MQRGSQDDKMTRCATHLVILSSCWDALFCAPCNYATSQLSQSSNETDYILCPDYQLKNVYTKYMQTMIESRNQENVTLSGADQ
jgi:hypothetical protein